MELAFLFILLVAVVKSELTTEQRAKLVAISDACMKETGISIEVLTKSLAGGQSEDPNLKDHLICIGGKIGFLSASGKQLKDVLKKNFWEIFRDEAIVDEIVQKCVKLKEIPQETAFESVKCFSIKYFI